ncbi:hypothetical protein LH51_14775 [Nitrincola sp. A-D6]|uniref:metallophosphoesterase n=1 Tax=Nitrincola sp. A-D6 TaxID=1545442 RepID=UPI00051FEE6A|nr:metallophosphoesterase [Nitrincola sp. A-D6]KGK41415.1 hypothetical protein LH51_14775 [Nitrincola sp. A-D6]
MKPVSLLQLSDCHLTPQAGELFRGVDPRHTLQAVVRHLRHSQRHFDLLLLSGDLVHHADAAVYRELLALLAPLELPIIWFAGNHDNVPAMQQAAPQLFAEVTPLQDWQLICLDSNHEPDGRGSGAVSPASLEGLALQLQATMDTPTLIALHHNPLPSGTDWQDQIMLSNADAFWAVIERAPQCKAVICGHLHQALSWQRQGVCVWSSPSTAAQFQPDTAVTLPAYRWYQLWPDGRIEAGCESVTLDNQDKDAL